MAYRGIYINLDRSTDRLAEMETELARVHLTERYQRLSAVVGNAPNLSSPLTNPNEIGCFLSHVAALKQGLLQNQPLHIIEDDVIFSTQTAATLDSVIASGALDEYDILYTDIALPLANNTLRKFKTLYDRAVTRDGQGKVSRFDFQTLNLRDEDYTAASSYLVNKNALEKLAKIYDNEIAAGVRFPIDDFLKLQDQVGTIRCGCLFPFVTSVRVEHTLDSTVRRKPDRTRKFTAANLARYSFFVDCDWAEAEHLLDEHLVPPPVDDRHAQFLAKLLAFSLTIPADD